MYSGPFPADLAERLWKSAQFCDHADAILQCMSTKNVRPGPRVVAVIMTFAMHIGLSHAASPADVPLSCGLGLPPGAAGFAEEQARQKREVEQTGYLTVCDANLQRYRIAFQPSASIRASLPFEPVNLSNTPFNDFTFLGAMVEPDNQTRSRLYRGFRMRDGHEVVLFEQDMSVDGTAIGRNPEDEPERINGLPARLSVFQAPSGKAISHLSWVEKRRAYELWIDANVAQTPLRQTLFSLAESLPRSIPACPNEIPPKPVRLGKDSFPIVEPMPMTLTAAEMNGRFDSSKRPCK